MDGRDDKPRWSLPICATEPADESKRRRVRAARIVGYILFGVVLIAPIVQFQHGTMKNLRRGEQFAAKYPAGPPAGVVPPKSHKGAIGRWRGAVREFWAGRNIYQARQPSADSAAGPPAGGVLHPNMPFTVILLSGFAYLPVPVMALAFNLLKLAAILAATYWLACLISPRRPVEDWVLGLAVVGACMMLMSDIRHGNVNSFVLAALALHLYLYSRARTLGAAAALALAICLKMTPALFVVYWLYQRSWKLLAATLAFLVLMAAIIPAVTVGPTRYAELTGTWLENLVLPGLVKGAWYPIHINQSLPGWFSRYFIGAPSANGDIFWNPDDAVYADLDRHGWITFVSLPEPAVKWLIRLAQAAVVLVGAWAIGWRKLRRDDPRLALHYGLVVCGMMLLNQRTWGHHGAVLLVAGVAVWHAIAFGRVGKRARRTALGLALGSWLLYLLGSTGPWKLAGKIVGASSTVSDYWADLADAYGLTFGHFCLLFAACTLLAVKLRGAEPPYAEHRQTLSQ